MKTIKKLLVAMLVGGVLSAGSVSAAEVNGPWQLAPVAGIPFWVGTKMAAVWPGYSNGSWTLQYTPYTFHKANAWCVGAGGNSSPQGAWAGGGVATYNWSSTFCPAGTTNTHGRVIMWI